MPTTIALDPSRDAADSVREGTLARRPALDGLRGLAVIAVILYHAAAGGLREQWVPGGFLGVDVFFVLSGFLITGILLVTRDRTGRTVSTIFWVRRARRLLPALLVMLAFCAAWGAFAAPRWELTSLRNQSFATLLYVQNWYRMFGDPGRAPLSHTWSLSIEEQWYLVWPFLLGGVLMATRHRRAATLTVLGAGVAASAAAMAWYFAAHGWSRAYGSTTARAGELILGGIIAIVWREWGAIRSERGRLAVEALAVLALLVLFAEFATLRATDALTYRGGSYLAAAATAVIIVAVLQPRSPIAGRVLSWRPIAATGLVSYGLYLFHVPLFRWMSPEAVGLDGVPLLALRLLVLAAMAAASYRWIEMPVREGRLRGREGRVAIAAIAATVVAILVVTSRAEPAPAWVFQRAQLQGAASALPRHTSRVLVAGELDAYDLSARTGRLVHRGVPGAASAAVATIGCNLVGNRPLIDGEPIAPIACDDWRDAFQAGMDAFDPDAVVLMAGQAELLDQRVGGRTLRVGTPEYERVLRDRLDEARLILTPRRGRLLLTTVPCVATRTADDSPTAQQLRDPVRLAWIDGVWRRYAADHRTTVLAVDLDPILCPGDDPRPVGAAGAVRAPDGRLTPIGATALWNHLVRVAVDAASSEGRDSDE
ncbi:MAG: acyltransferase family protein [Actinomycetota bacterium]